VSFRQLIFGKSLWDSGFSIYKLNVEPGDIITIRFSDSTVLKYDIQQKEAANQTTEGKKGIGAVFSFYPDAGVNDADTMNNRDTMQVNNQNKFLLPAKISDIKGDSATVDGSAASIINGNLFKISFSGEFSLRSLNSDMTVNSTDIYNLSFNAAQSPSVESNLITEDDLVFKTNYSDITTNQVFDSTNNITNILVVTNPSSMTIDFKGIADPKKKDLIINYLNVIMNALFK